MNESRSNGPAVVPLRIGDWRVDPAAGQITRMEQAVRVEARTMRLLLCLAAHPGEVVSIDELLDQVWSGVIVTPDSVYQAVTSLRRLLGDDPKRPTYIATVPRLGYRMVAAVGPCIEPLPAEPTPADLLHVDSPLVPPPGAHRRWGAGFRAGAVLILVLAVSLVGVKLASRHGNVPPPQSIAVLPFLDLTTQAMNEEYFADGMTEELIDDLSKIPGLRVPGPTSSFYFKDKSLPVADIAKKLGVAYVLDGSVRQSGSTFRVAARLIRADNGYVVWTETYDRPLNDQPSSKQPRSDILAIQKDIAAEMTKSMRVAVNNTASDSHP